METVVSTQDQGQTFGAFFAEAAGQVDEVSPGSALTVDAAKATPPTGEAGIPPVEDKPVETTPVTTETKPTETKPTETKPTETKPTETPDYEKLYKETQSELDKTNQRMKSWEGRLSAAEQKNKELASQLGQQIQGTPAVTPVQLTEDQSKAVAASEETLAAFIAEMGDDFIKPLNLLLNKTIQEQTGSLTKQLSEALGKITAYEEQLLTQHYEAIEDAHPDIETLVKDGLLSNWAKTLPFEEAEKAINILKSGSAKQVIKLVTKYKEATKEKETPASKETNTETPPVSRDVVNAATVVKTGTPSILPPAKANKNDFVGAFAEAVEKDEKK